MKRKLSMLMMLSLIVSMSPILSASHQKEVDPKNYQIEENEMIEEKGSMFSLDENQEGEITLVKRQEMNSDKDIVDTASGDSRFTTLVSALKAADLTNTLKGQGPYTVFAPTNDAFAKLPAGTVENLLKPENKEKLKDLLTYHVFPGKVLASDATNLNGQEITMANGKKAKVEVRDGALYIDGAKVVAADIMAKNGVIHVIDTVMMP